MTGRECEVCGRETCGHYSAGLCEACAGIVVTRDPGTVVDRDGRSWHLRCLMAADDDAAS
jgi:hypothetical protein